MIRRITGALPPLCHADVYGTRTVGYHNSYGTEQNDVAFYAQEADGFVTGVLSDAFSQGSLTMTDNADAREWKEFICFLGLQTLLCDKKTATRLKIPVRDSGSVMRFLGAERVSRQSFIDANDPAFSFADVYRLLQNCGFALGDYAAWFSDFALRVRRGTADVRCVYRDGVLASTASVLFRSEDAVYLGAVGTDPAFRGQGLAGDLVLSLTQSGKRAEILCRVHRVSFYQSLGFQKIGDYALCHFSK